MTRDEDTYPKNILIVEDDALIAIDLEDVMESAGFKVVGTLSQVDQALDFLNDMTPDVALLDFNLGNENSVPVAKKLDEMNVPFMFLSGQTKTVVLEDLNADPPVLGKPFRPSQLVDQVKDLADA